MPNAQSGQRRPGLKDIFGLVKAAAKEWSEDKASRLGAALAYYTVFSLAPLLILAIAVAGLVVDPGEAQQAIVDQLRGLLGPEGASLVSTMIDNARQQSTAGIVATVVGLATLIFGALGAFNQLQDSLNTIWEVRPKPDRGIMGVIRDRLLSLAMVLVIGFLLLVSMVVSAALATLSNFIASLLPMSSVVLWLLNFAISVAVVTVLFALIFKYLPDVKLAWSDVWIGAVTTALLFTIGQFLIGLYLGNAAITSTYGAAGSLVVLLLWVYYSALILFFGAELTQVYANRYGSEVEPADNAVRLTEAERAQQGIPHAAQAQRAVEAAESQPEEAVAARGKQLPVVGPYLALPGQQPPALVEGEPLERPFGEPLKGREALMALLTFAAGLGMGAVYAGSRRRPAARSQDHSRRTRRS